MKSLTASFLSAAGAFAQTGLSTVEAMIEEQAAYDRREAAGDSRSLIVDAGLGFGDPEIYEKTIREVVEPSTFFSYQRRWHAARDMARVGWPELPSRLIGRLDETDAFGRICIVMALGIYGGHQRRAEPGKREDLTELEKAAMQVYFWGGEAERKAAEWSLGFLREDPKEGPVESADFRGVWHASYVMQDDPDEGSKKRAVEYLVRSGTDAVEPLIAALMREDDSLRDLAIDALVRIGRPGVDILIRTFVRRQGLGRISEGIEAVLLQVGVPAEKARDLIAFYLDWVLTWGNAEERILDVLAVVKNNIGDRA